MIIISAQHCAPPRGAPPRNERCPSLLQFNGERLEPRLQHKCVYIDVYDLLLFILRAATDVAIRASAAASRKAAVDTPFIGVASADTFVAAAAAAGIAAACAGGDINAAMAAAAARVLSRCEQLRDVACGRRDAYVQLGVLVVRLLLEVRERLIDPPCARAHTEGGAATQGVHAAELEGQS
eukprot:TRINITY_DN3442_c0_g1_i3.p1 TRINITY_DN3442_c0_g1~~TRINITY_DN3442_c0_g1_i3.p1  ORF type:complete len:181 (+),score=43.38 TRINITY_DN3442_c0_g1_i3:123-665(+)